MRDWSRSNRKATEIPYVWGTWRKIELGAGGSGIIFRQTELGARGPRIIFRQAELGATKKFHSHSVSRDDTELGERDGYLVAPFVIVCVSQFGVLIKVKSTMLAARAGEDVVVVVQNVNIFCEKN